MEQNVLEQKQYKQSLLLFVSHSFVRVPKLVIFFLSVELSHSQTYRRSVLDRFLQNRAGPSYLRQFFCGQQHLSQLSCSTIQTMVFSGEHSIVLLPVPCQSPGWLLLPFSRLYFRKPKKRDCNLWNDYSQDHSFSLPRLLKLHQNIIDRVIFFLIA